MPPVKKIKIQEISVELYSALPAALQKRYKMLRTNLKDAGELKAVRVEEWNKVRVAIEARPDYPRIDLFVSSSEQRQEIYERQQAMKNTDRNYVDCQALNAEAASIYHDAACQFAKFKNSAAFLFEIPHLEMDD
jgi:hypothetical protein